MEKTGITEAGILVTILGMADGAQHLLLANPILPDPWGGFALGTLGLVVYFLRRAAKKKAEA
jgi:hypothetical protein